MDCARSAFERSTYDIVNSSKNIATALPARTSAMHPITESSGCWYASTVYDCK